MWVKPGKNRETGEQLRVRIPHTFALMNPDGEQVPDNTFWRWMLRQRDVVLCDPPEQTTPETKS